MMEMFGLVEPLLSGKNRASFIMKPMNSTLRFAAAACLGILLAGSAICTARAQDQATGQDAAAASTQAPEPLTEEELEVLVARIALYPDELVGLISGASLYPLQIVEAARFLDDYEKDKSLKPKDSWDGSVISLLNYPEIVKMMSDDLDWTQALASALAYQQQDLLIAIQQLRDEAVANGIIKSDDKIQVVEEGDNIVIESASTETIYVPQYEPQILYDTAYPPQPVSYYPNPYPHYYYPTATFFAGAVTGAIWAAAVDWDDWGVWGGNWHGGKVDIDCNNCFNNRDFNGRINSGDIDWRNVDRSKINIDRDQLGKIDRNNIRNDIKGNRNNSIRDKAAQRPRASTLPANARGAGSRDVRKSVQEGLKAQPRPRTQPRASGQRPAQRPTRANRPAGKPKAAAKRDSRPKKASGMGNVSKGKKQKVSSKRGSKSMGGGQRSRSSHKSVRRPSGGGRGGRGGGRGGGRRR